MFRVNMDDVLEFGLWFHFIKVKVLLSFEMIARRNP
jgi:hypothetical protein